MPPGPNCKRRKVRLRDFECGVCFCLLPKRNRQRAHRECLGEKPSVKRRLQDTIRDLVTA